ncbi:dihydrofolate reductase [Glaciihabitans sp. UYNi722]|uniref:dihydrofolate reductase n=1 Tax=Glaciihabitans sp. UYNi722 TaxID=3156344 RepID=UPI0033951CF5
MSVALIWAEAHEGVIGRDGEIPWHIPEDLAHFKELTGSGVVVMGRRTWDSIPERFRPLPGRRNIVVTRQLDWTAPGAEVVHSIDERLFAGLPDDVWVMGGGEIYRQSLPFASRLEVTEVDLEVEGKTVAPSIDDSWQRTQDPINGWHLSRTGTLYRFASFRR